MIRKITNGEYLKRIGSMTEAERMALAERVGEWLQKDAPLLTRRENDPLARMQNVMQVGISWNDNEQAAWTEGVRLLTPFVGTADTWLPEMLYTKAVRRSIRKIVEILTANFGKLVERPKSAPQPQPTRRTIPAQTEQSERRTATAWGTASKSAPTTASIAAGIVMGNGRNVASNANNVAAGANNEQPVEPKKRGRGRPKGSTKKKADAEQQPGNSLTATDAKSVVPRPKHIDQYAHLLPEATQQRAAQYGPLMRDLETARQNMRLLMDDTHATATERERWAKTAVRLDDHIGNIRKELDDEWNKVVATGRVVIDDFGMAHILDPTTGKVNDPQPKVDFKGVDDKPKPKEDDKPKRSHHKQLTDEEKAKRTVYLQKWLRDRRPTASDEHRKQWEANARELIRLGGHLTDSMRQTGEHYGARIPKAKR